jgi:hypothetical protein
MRIRKAIYVDFLDVIKCDKINFLGHLNFVHNNTLGYHRQMSCQSNLTKAGKRLLASQHIT